MTAKDILTLLNPEHQPRLELNDVRCLLVREANEPAVYVVGLLVSGPEIPEPYWLAIQTKDETLVQNLALAMLMRVQQAEGE